MGRRIWSLGTKSPRSEEIPSVEKVVGAAMASLVAGVVELHAPARAGRGHGAHEHAGAGLRARVLVLAWHERCGVPAGPWA